MSDSIPDIGMVWLYDSVLPGLRAGQYCLEVGQEVTGPGVLLDEPDARCLRFDVSGLQWRLGDADVFSVYPPPNTVAPILRVPLAVLHDRELPWSRTLAGGVDPNIPDDTPWMHLLVIRKRYLYSPSASSSTVELLGPEGGDGSVGDWLVEGDIELRSEFIPGVATTDEAIRVASAITRDARPADVLPLEVVEALGLDDLPAAEAARLAVDTMKVPGETLRALLPTIAELRLLAHVRRVNLSDKALVRDDPDGWFSALLSNRILQPDSEYVAAIISLEGWAALLQDTRADPHPLDARLSDTFNVAVLRAWSFRTMPSGLDFESLVTALDIGAMGAAVPEVSLDRAARDGTRDAVRYRSPLVVPDTEDPNPPAKSAPFLKDAEEIAAGRSEATKAARRAAGLGVEVPPPDITLAAAFELGRLLGASDRPFVAGMLQWHGTLAEARTLELRQDDDVLDAQSRIEAELDGLFSNNERLDPEELRELREIEHLRRAVTLNEVFPAPEEVDPPVDPVDIDPNPSFEEP
ncbi:MAG: hypothetical protein H6739_35135 [Alphaproteobacteria bacterium]|nr:hypothetical protein [Alphaproteobacteria bacterium]